LAVIDFIFALNFGEGQGIANLHLFSEVIAKDRSAIPQQVARELVKGKCLAELLSNPLRGRVRSH
jgi:hypothetical protein